MPTAAVPPPGGWPLAVTETFQEEMARLGRLKQEDPIAVQDALCTSQALLEAVKENDIDELRSVLANAIPGELLQVYIIQAFMIALKATSLTIVKEMVDSGMTLELDHVSQSLHLICEVVTRENFSDAWRIIELLVEGGPGGNLIIDMPRVADGWTPLCIASARACLPLCFKLLELKADPNSVTRKKETPVSLAREAQPDDTAEQQEARGIIANMLRSYGGCQTAAEAMHAPPVSRLQSSPQEPRQQISHDEAKVDQLKPYRRNADFGDASIGASIGDASAGASTAGGAAQLPQVATPASGGYVAENKAATHTRWCA